MLDDRQGGRGRNRVRRAFRPGLDGRADQALESRLLLSSATVTAETIPLNNTKNIQSRVAFGGKVTVIRDTDLELFDVDVIGAGRIRAQPMSGGRVRLILEGSDSLTQIAVNQESRRFRKGTAHEFPPRAGIGDHLLHIGEIKITSGKINAILAYQTADLSGPVVLAGTTPVDRIAFQALKPGASIVTGGDLNTFDVFNDLTLGGGPGITVGRDLNWMLIGGNLNVGPGSTFLVTRDVGLVPQLPKGSDPGGQGALIQGNMSVDPTGSFIVGSTVEALFLVDGTLSGANRVQIGFGGGNVLIRGGIVS
jgi:hypothetical protein